METNQELLFARTLEKVRELAKEQGNCVSKSQVREAFAEFELDEDRLELVYDYLIKHKVGVERPADPDGYLTEEERDYLKRYLDEAAALPEYTPGEIEAYTLSAMAGDKDARHKLAEIHLKDAAEIAKLYVGQGVFLGDLVGEGCAALVAGSEMLGGLESPDEAHGMLGRMMMNAMEKLIAETEANRRADQKAEDHVNKVAEQARALAEELRRKVTVEELARETGMSADGIREAMRISGFMIEDLTDE